MKYTIDSKKVKALLFDWDGTLVDTEALQHAANVRFFNELKINYVSLEEQVYLYGGQGFKPIYEKLLGPITDEELDKIKTVRRTYFIELLNKHGIEEVTGVLKLIKNAHKMKIKLAIVTGASKKSFAEAVSRSKVPIRLFEAVVNREDYLDGKPHPQPFLIGASKLGVDPKECVVFENAPNGIRSAIAAGMDFVALTTNLPEERFKEIDPNAKTIKDFTEVKIV